MPAHAHAELPDTRRPARVLELLGYEMPDWHRDALCREHLELDFVSRTPTVQAAAIQICGRCAVREDCLAVALADPTLVGVWGGTTDSARRVMRRARRIGAAGGQGEGGVGRDGLEALPPGPRRSLQEPVRGLRGTS